MHVARGPATTREGPPHSICAQVSTRYAGAPDPDSRPAASAEQIGLGPQALLRQGHLQHGPLPGAPRCRLAARTLTLLRTHGWSRERMLCADSMLTGAERSVPPPQLAAAAHEKDITCPVEIDPQLTYAMLVTDSSRIQQVLAPSLVQTQVWPPPRPRVPKPIDGSSVMEHLFAASAPELAVPPHCRFSRISAGA